METPSVSDQPVSASWLTRHFDRFNPLPHFQWPWKKSAYIFPRDIQWKARIDLRNQAELEPLPEWRKRFKRLSELQSAPSPFLIDGFLPMGVTFIAGLSGVGKTWLALSKAKALTTGEPFLGLFEVLQPCNVLYLIPEAGESQFLSRLKLMGIPDDDRFLCRTLNDEPMDLDNSDLLEAVGDLKPVVFLDTAIRFRTGEENSASDNRGMADSIFQLRRAGAQSIIGLHHSPKNFAKGPVTLEKALRGTTDFGAMCDAAYALRCEDKETAMIQVHCVKSRDFESPSTFTIQGRPFIEETGDFRLVDAPKQIEEKAQARKLDDLLLTNPNSTYEAIAKALGKSKASVKNVTNKAGWIQRKGQWQKVA